jgi:subfamily B ATP-binding cassette protein HlyB/CyaB
MSDEHQGSAVQAEAETGLACLVMIARFHKVTASPRQLAHEYLDNGRQLAKPELLLAKKGDRFIFYAHLNRKINLSPFYS